MGSSRLLFPRDEISTRSISAVNDPENARLLFYSVNSVIQICTKRNRTKKQQSMIDDVLRDIFLSRNHFTIERKRSKFVI